MQKIIKEADHTKLFGALATELLNSLANAVDADGVAVLGLCGGRSVVGLLKALMTSKDANDVLKDVQFFMVDERLVPITDEQSNFRLLNELLFLELLGNKTIQRRQIHPFEPDDKQSDFGAANYLRILNGFGGAFTSIVLGMGEDGHVAGLFPKHPALESAGREFLTFFDSPKPPPARMTASLPLLTSAKTAILLAIGEGKRNAYERFQDHYESIEDCPAKLVSGIETVVIGTDL